MAYSDDNNFTTMQEEAIRRVREMQRRSRSIVGASPNSEPALPKAEETPRTQNAHSQQKAPQSSSLLSGLLGGNLGDIKIDEEKALIGLLIYILYKQGADIKLLLALGYLLL